jgi:hypothetical protein
MMRVEINDKPSVVQVQNKNNIIDVYSSVGIQGPTGLPGSQIISGQTPPDPEIGVIGDYYLDKSVNDFYGPKTQENGWGTPTRLGNPEFENQFDIDSPSDQDVIMFDVSSGKWTNTQIRYRHVQTFASDIWVIDHNLNSNPGGISIVDTAETVIIGDVTYEDLNRIVVVFTEAVSGKAYIS